jgi:hypothetical protein
VLPRDQMIGCGVVGIRRGGRNAVTPPWPVSSQRQVLD